jgi:integrase/recombinase XerD
MVIMHSTEPDNLDSLLAGWLDSGRRGSPHTKDAYRRDVRAFARFSSKPITETQPGDLINYQAYLRHQVGSAATEYRKLTSLRSFFKYLKLTNAISEDLAAVIQAPRVESDFKAKALSVDEVQAIIEASAGNPLDSLLLRLLYVTGGRISEVLALRWMDMAPTEEGGGYARILGKGRKCREVYIGPELWADLATTDPLNARAEDEPLFDFDRHEAAAIIKKAAKAARIGKTVTPHVFRHSLASNLLERGATLAQVRDQLGHADIKTTSLYLHATDRTAMIRDMPIK